MTTTKKPSVLGSRVEVLEPRIAPANLFVDNAGDFVITTDTGSPGLTNGDTVTWNPGVGSGHAGPQTGLIFGTNAFSTIAAAITAASSTGDTIRVGPGTFAESITVNKSVQILGNQVSVDATSRVGQQETIVTSSAGAFIITASNVRVTGFTVEGQTIANGAGISVPNAVNGININNNIIKDNLTGLKLNTSSGAASSVVQNLFEDNNVTLGGRAILSDVRLEEVRIARNSVVGDHPSAAISISGTTGSGRRVVIEDNTLTGPGGSPFSDAIFLGANIPATSEIAIRNNFINGWDIAVVVNTGLPGITVRGNDLSNNSPSATLFVASGSTVDAAFNFYGVTTEEEVANRAPGLVDFQPFLTEGTDADPATAGFQPTLQATLVNPTTATYTDPDGDLVTVKVSKGTLESGDLRFILPERGDGLILSQLILTDPALFSGANVNITAKRTIAGGDGLAVVGQINATGVDLGNIAVRGDLASLLVGDPAPGGIAINKISIVSSTTAATSLGFFQINGSVGNLTVLSDFLESVSFVGGEPGNVGTLFIGGLLTGVNTVIGLGGSIIITGNLTKATILGNIGGLGTDGRLRVDGNVGTVLVGGSLFGSTDSGSGSIRIGGDAGSVKIKGSLIGGVASDTGHLLIGGNVKTIAIGGSLIGGGVINIDSNVGSFSESGFVTVRGNANKVTIGGSVVAGQDSSGDVQGGLRFGGRVKTLAIAGDVRSDVVTTVANLVTAKPIVISVLGGANPTTPAEAVALAKFTIGGSVTNAEILIGYEGTQPRNPDAALGSLFVKGNWTISSLAVGIDNGADNRFGTNDDAGISPSGAFSDGPAVASIANLIVNGPVAGTPAFVAGFSGIFDDDFGFVAESFRAVRFSGVPLPLTTAGDDLLVAATLDVRLREI